MRYKNKMKFSHIKIDITLMKFTKLNELDNSNLLDEKFYINQGIQGELLNNNENDPKQILKVVPQIIYK